MAPPALASGLVISFDHRVPGLPAGMLLPVMAYGDAFKCDIDFDENGAVDYICLRRNKKARLE